MKTRENVKNIWSLSSPDLVLYWFTSSQLVKEYCIVY